jgi:hypothetical protein
MPTINVPIYGCRKLDRQIKLSSSACVKPGYRGEGARFVCLVSPTTKEDPRDALDRVLFALRLWKSGRFACPTVFKDRCLCCVNWYCTPWKTWSHSRVETPLDWAGDEAGLRKIWGVLQRPGGHLKDHRLRRFGQFYFYPVAVDRFSMLFMAADGLLFPYPTRTHSSACAFAKRGARSLAPLLPGECERDIEEELAACYKKRNGEFHGRTNTLGKDIQRPAERMELFVRRLLLYFLGKRLLMCREKAEKHIQELLASPAA